MGNMKRVRGKPATEFEDRKGQAEEIQWGENVPKHKPVKVHWDGGTGYEMVDHHYLEEIK